MFKIVELITRNLENHKDLSGAIKFSKKLFNALVKGLILNETITTERIFTLVFTFNQKSIRNLIFHRKKDKRKLSNDLEIE